MEISFEIAGKPMSKQRPRMTKKGFVYTPKETIAYENYIKCVFQNKYPSHEPFTGIVEADIKAIFPVPKSYSKKKTKELLETHDNYTHKPDLDNIAKIVLDSLNGIAYRDDSQVTILHLNKEYGVQPKVIVKLEEKS